MMDKTRPTSEHLSSWLDDELDAEQKRQVDAWLREHPEDAAQLRLWAADQEALRARFDPVLDEPVPEALRHTVMATAASAQRWGPFTLPSLRQAALVAGLLLTGGVIGAGLMGLYPSAHGQLQARLGTPAGWTHRAAVAHVVYAPEVRHPVEVNVAQGSAGEQKAQEEHLSRWLTKRLDMPVRMYDLRPQGFELVGGRLLPDAAGPSAQLMYQNAVGQRVTVYLRKPETGANTSFSFRREGELGMFYWVEDGFGCALVGKLGREQLLALADAVYKQSEQIADSLRTPTGGAPAPASGTQPAASPRTPS